MLVGFPTLHATWGDRLNELVFIGQGLDIARMTHDREQCLCHESEVEHYLDGGTFNYTWPL